MHEVMVAKAVLAAIAQEVAKLNAKPISAKISCGQLYAINDDSLQFAFKLACEGTPCEGMALTIEHKPLVASCKDCGNSFDVDIHLPRCPKCSGVNLKYSEDAPLLLEQVEFEEKS